MTPKYAWENIKNYIPKDKVLWEAFYGDGTSGTYLQQLGYDCIHEDIDFFQNDKGDMVVSNPPYSLSKEVLTRLKELNKPFILIMPSSKINTQYFRRLFQNDESPVQIIIPRKRIHFEKLVNGVKPENWKNACNFDCFYYCWKIGLERDIIWLKDEECIEMKKKKDKKKKKPKHKKKLKLMKNVIIKKNTTIKKRGRRKKKEMQEAKDMMQNDINIL